MMIIGKQKKKKKRQREEWYNERDASKEYHWTCTQPPEVSLLLQHSNQSDSPISGASAFQLRLPLPKKPSN